jgi:hypothetical protein
METEENGETRGSQEDNNRVPASETDHPANQGVHNASLTEVYSHGNVSHREAVARNDYRGQMSEVEQDAGVGV